MIRLTSDELRQYITSLLQLTRVEARDIKLSKEACDINAVVAQVIERVRPLAKAKNIDIRQNLETLFSLDLDRILIGEVLINLIENAIKYSSDNSWISVSTQEVDNEVRVIIEDRAGGIPEDEIPRIFDKFYRGREQNTSRVTGTGLGLYLVKYFIELHGGKVFIESNPGEGTKIGFSLPLESPEEEYVQTTLARAHR